MSGARCVFVGNVPYDATEQSLATHFSQVGPVVSVRLLFDKDTGKPRGFGFVEFYDSEHASSAVRNLNNVEFCGRSLRINIASNPPAGMGGPRDHHDSDRRDRERDRERERDGMQGDMKGAKPSGSGGDGGQFQQNSGPPEDEATRSTRVGVQIARTIESLSAELIYEIMRQLKTAIQNNPNEARNMLLAHPQLAYAVLQAQIQLGIVEPRVALAMLHRSAEQIPPLTAESHKAQLPERISAILTPASAAMPPPAPPGGVAHHPSFTGSPFSAPFTAPNPNPGPGYGAPPGSFTGAPYGAPYSNQSAPPFGAPPYGPPPSFAPPNNAVPPRSNEPETDEEAEKRALLMQVLQLSDEQIAQLPADQRQSVLALKEQMRCT